MYLLYHTSFTLSSKEYVINLMESEGIEPYLKERVFCTLGCFAVQYLGGYPDAAVTPHDTYYYSTCCALCQVKNR